MTRGASYRGQPVLVLLLVAAVWAGTRIALWDAPFARAADGRPAMPSQAVGSSRAVAPNHAVPAIAFAPSALSPMFVMVRQAMRIAPSEFAHGEQVQALEGTIPGTTWLMASAMAEPQPPGRTAIPPFPVMAGDPDRTTTSRWSGDAWVLLRNDTVTPVTSGRGSYGRSQAGAVLRYRLVPSSGHRPAGYLRVSSSLDGPREAEVALGLSARPLASVPIVVAAEVRGARFAGDTEARPAAFAYSEFPPIELPLGARGEAYVQGGYVGGRYATPFIDGQVRIDRPLVRLGPAELRAGGGVWGGAQEGAERIDVGPGASVALDLGPVPVRVSADWRFRVAGEANPSSGPALTVSAGF